MKDKMFTRPAVVMFTALALSFGIAGSAVAQDTAPQVITDKSPAGELDFWNKIKDSKNKADFQTYLQNFPNGMFFDPAMQKFQDAGGSKDELTAGDGTPPKKIETVTPPALVVAAPPATKPKPVVKATKKKAVVKKAVVKSTVKKKKFTTTRVKKTKVVSCGKGSTFSKGQCRIKTKSAVKVPKRKAPIREMPSGGDGGNSGGGGGWSG